MIDGSPTARLDEMARSVVVEGVPPALTAAIGAAITSTLRGGVTAVEGSLDRSMADNAMFSRLLPEQQERLRQGFLPMEKVAVEMRNGMQVATLRPIA